MKITLINLGKFNYFPCVFIGFDFQLISVKILSIQSVNSFVNVVFL